MPLNRRHLLIAVGAVLLRPRAARAHAGLVRSTPEDEAILTTSPAQVVLVFNEAIEPAFSSIRVTDTIGRRVDRGEVAVAQDRPETLATALEPLENGAYDVAWRVASADGHSIEGAFVFTVTTG